MSAGTGSTVSGDACGTGGCDHCVFGCAPTPTRRDTGAAVTVTASGVAIAVLAGVLAATAAGWVVGPAVAAAVAGGAQAGLGGLALRDARGRGERALAAAAAVLPVATGALLVALAARGVAFLLG